VVLCFFLLHDDVRWWWAGLFGLVVAVLGSGLQKQEDEAVLRDRHDGFWDR
jgi:hypothetical protein